MDDAIALVGVIAGALAAVLALAGSIIAWRTKKKVRDTEKQVQQIHILVNSRMSDMETRVRQLIAALDESGTPVPASLEQEGAEDASS